jgi:hypothetical protein
MHGPSTGKFEIEASWQEWVDDLAKDAPELIKSHGQLGEIQLGENHVNEFDLDSAVAEQVPASGKQRAPGNRHDFGDTKFRLIQYTMRATTRFREYLPAALYDQRDQVTRAGPVGPGPAMQVGADNDPGAPVLKLATGTGANTIVRSSSPPAEPRIVYVVPTFKWDDTKDDGSLDSTRLGNGLRVWLERPWFSSGDGELLGVVILGEGKNFTDITAEMVPLATQWGLDPLWDSALPKYRTRASDFPARVTDETVSLREMPTKQVQVIGHRVHWDGDRRMWYCDIELDAGQTYLPFVRLALVRYQPNAVDDAKISKVVLTDFAQVMPRRRVTWQRSGAHVAFTLHGIVPTHGPLKFPLDSEYLDISFEPSPFATPEAGQNRVELVLQTRDPAIDSDLEWSDVNVLGSSLVPADGGGGTTTGGGRGPFTGLEAAHAGGAAATGVLGRLAPGHALNLGRVGAMGRPAGAISERDVSHFGELIDPTLWSTTVNVPDLGGKPARIAVREYERYYSDRTVSEQRAGAMRKRRVVEERLVYTSFFDL